MQKEWHQAIPNLIKEEQRYINKSGNAEGERDEKTEKKTEDKQRNKMQRFDRLYDKKGYFILSRRAN